LLREKYFDAFSISVLILHSSVGFKFNPNPFFVLGFEVGARYALTDNLDGSNPENQYANNLNYKFGNINNNDWYIFTGFTISFTFGDLPCYCKE